MSNIVETIRNEGFKLKKCGDVYKMPCPFHDDSEPSLAVYPETESFYCFGCHKSGDVIDFLQRVNDQNFVRTFKFMIDESKERNGGEVPTKEYAEIMDVCQMYVFWAQYYESLRRLNPRKSRGPRDPKNNPETTNEIKYAKISIE